MDSEAADLKSKRFLVCIDEIKQNFVFGDQWSGNYCRTVTLSDGSVRTIELTPMIRNGTPVVEFKDSGGRTYMGLNSTTTNGNLMVQVLDLDAAEAASRPRPSSSPVLPRDTSLLALPDFVPPDFAQGVEILNDHTTPMRFVVSVLESQLGLKSEDAHRIMLDIHARGGALIATDSVVQAQSIAAQIAADAARQGFPLVCRSVGPVS